MIQILETLNNFLPFLNWLQKKVKSVHACSEYINSNELKLSRMNIGSYTRTVKPLKSVCSVTAGAS